VVITMAKPNFNKEDPQVADFLGGPRVNPLDRLKSFQEALSQPDAPPARQIANLHAAAETLAQPPAPQTQSNQREAVTQELVSLPTVTPDLRRNDAEAGVYIPHSQPAKVGRPLLGRKPKVEKTFAIDDDLHRRLINISNWEGIRHDKKFSVSHIMNHLLEYALSHVDGTKVIPIDGEEGLVITRKEVAQ
jgi:hypothetical protein